MEVAKESVKADSMRAQLVFLYSSLDSYMHEIIAYGTVMMFFDIWRRTKEFGHLLVGMGDVLSLYESMESNSPERISCVKNMVLYGRQYDTMMKFDVIKSELSGIGLDDTYLSALDNYRDTLDSAYRRRNRIVHQADRKKPTSNRLPIVASEVSSEIDVFERLQKDIHSMIEEYERGQGGK